MSRIYVYCLSDELRAERFAPVAGVAGAETELFEHGGLGVVVSLFAGERARVTREDALAHNRVNSAMLERATVLPFRFGVAVSRQQLEEYVDSQSQALRAALERVRGCAEMSVKVLWDTVAMKRESAESAGAEVAAGAGAGGSQPTPGAAYLLAKRRALLGDRRLRERAEEIAAWLGERLGEAVREEKRRVRPAEALVLKAAYLVEKERLADYRERLERARAERPQLSFLTSGAWPPYSFCELRPPSDGGAKQF